MLRIGEMARIAGVSLRTLRHYDAIGLLRPHAVGLNGYRHYTPSQLADLRHIVSLRTLGFSLDAIRAVVAGEPFEAALLRRREQLHAERAAVERQLFRIDDLLRKEKTMSEHRVELRHLPAVSGLSASGTATDYRHVAAPMGELFERVLNAIPTLGLRHVGPCVAVWGGGGYESETQIDLQTVVGTAGTPNGSSVAGVETAELPAVTAACVRHVGSYERFGDAYAALLAWTAREHYATDGPVREVYLHQDRDPDRHVSELHLPVRRIA